MSEDVAHVAAGASLAEVVRLLIRRGVKAVPVVDEVGRVIGIITGGDLLRRGDVDLRLSLQQQLTPEELKDQLADLLANGKTAADVMTRHPVTIGAETPIDDRPVDGSARHQAAAGGRCRRPSGGHRQPAGRAAHNGRWRSSGRRVAGRGRGVTSGCSRGQRHCRSRRSYGRSGYPVRNGLEPADLDAISTCRGHRIGRQSGWPHHRCGSIGPGNTRGVPRSSSSPGRSVSVATGAGAGAPFGGRNRWRRDADRCVLRATRRLPG